MVRYLLLQCKRLARYLPGALLAMAVLLCGLGAVFSMLTQRDAQSEDNQKFQVAMVGTAEDTFVQMGLAALQTFDSTKLSMEIVEMEEQEARAALEKGTIGAYIVVPENFVDEAMNGRILPLQFVSTMGSAGTVSLFKEEITSVISILVLESQRGVYGMQGAMKAEELSGRGDHMNYLALEYVEYVLLRDRTYRVEELGISNALGLGEYLLCGLSVLFLFLACLPFAPLMIRFDLSLERVLAARGRSALSQTLVDLGVYTLGLCAGVWAVTALAGWLLSGLTLPDFFHLLPVAVLAACFSFMLYALSGDLIGGVLLQFFLMLALCFISGCMYPVHFFPTAVQQLAQWLPTGAARNLLASGLTGVADWKSFALVLCYSGVFSLAGVIARLRAIREGSV